MKKYVQINKPIFWSSEGVNLFSLTHIYSCDSKAVFTVSDCISNNWIIGV